MNLETARKFANTILERVCFDQAIAVGSIRREVEDVKDIDLLFPWMDAKNDEIYRKLEELIITPHDTLPVTRGLPERFLTRLHNKGFKPGFKSASLLCEPSKVWGVKNRPFKVECYRYIPGDFGNGGMQALYRTGPGGEDGFGAAVIRYWKQYRGPVAVGPGGNLPASRFKDGELKGSDEGFLLDRFGQPMPTPTEQSVFELLNIEWVDHKDRTDGRNIKPRIARVA